ncbi:MAG: DNA mismatch repair protein MutS [Treponema sp.]|jgi:DNA mismatch repair protein MutS|nr:DNA mismatch repair protein MutS [Treponema sp.]
MLEQYRRIKSEHKEDVLFFRLGDFYEMFADDALEISSLLNLTLTTRNGLPMCGIPYHAARSYIARLLKAGKKVAICEQLSEAVRGGSIIERKVVEIITPGTTVDEDFLDKGSSNYLACIASRGHLISFAYIDLSTGDFFVRSFGSFSAKEKLRGELERIQARELLVQESLLEENSGIAAAIGDQNGIVVNRWADWLFDMERSAERLKRQFSVTNLKGFGLEEGSIEILAAGALLDYLDDTSKSLIPHVCSIQVYQDSDFMGIDESTQRNLELVRNLRDGDTRFSLLEVLDETRSAMGRRLLKSRILMPLQDIRQINARLDMTESFYRNQGKLSRLRELLGKMQDLERLSSRLAMDKAHGKDILTIKNALEHFFDIDSLCPDLNVLYESAAAHSLGKEEFSRLKRLVEILQKGIRDDPSILLTEGNLIRAGYNSRLDELMTLRDSGRKLLENYLEEEKRQTGITSLKIRYNRLIGYFFEVTKAHLNRVPEHFIRRQGIVAGERFTTDRLAALESDINGASDRIIDLEKELFLELREEAKKCLREIAAASRRIAEIDVAQSAARAATIQGWTRPVLDGEERLKILEGRHPVVEAHLPRGEFIPNDIILDSKEICFALITGPNMAGKSTYLRQAALICIMAQMGSFVPAREALIGICDRIYCRVGASDNLARGESTFLAEMSETAYILHTATERSLVIMDEVGRGTGTTDGLSIAWAVSEDLLNRIGCRTLFATHYHELSGMEHPHLANRSMEVLEQGGEIVFLRKLKEGPSAESYGLHAASLAGLPRQVLDRAAFIQEAFKARELSASADSAPEKTALKSPPPGSLRPAEASGPGKVLLGEISMLEIERMTPMEALYKLHELKERFGPETSFRPVPARPKKIRPPEDNPSLFDLW